MRLQDKIAIVTGAGSGFGAGIARKFAAEGARVVVADLNGDGKPEIMVTESGTFCYGNTGQGFYVMEQTGGGWRTLFQSQGVPEFLPTKGAGGWPDIVLGGPGFCFPVVRFNGKAYANHRQKEEQPGACALR